VGDDSLTIELPVPSRTQKEAVRIQRKLRLTLHFCKFSHIHDIAFTFCRGTPRPQAHQPIMDTLTKRTNLKAWM
jgi:hypothetical protein